MLRKIFTPLYVGEKFLSPEVWEKNSSQTKSPILRRKTQMVNSLRGGGRNRFDSKCHSSTKWLARVHHVVVFKTKVLHFKIENTPINDTNGKGKFKECSISFLRTSGSFLLIVFREIQPCFLHCGALSLFSTNQGSEVFEQISGTFCTLWSRKICFEKGFFYIYKGFMDVFYILTSA